MTLALGIALIAGSIVLLGYALDLRDNSAGTSVGIETENWSGFDHRL